MVHASPLIGWLLALDPRMTYPVLDDTLFTLDCHPVVTGLDGTTTGLLISGTPEPPDGSGRMHYEFVVTDLGGGLVEVAGARGTITDTTPAPLPGSGYYATPEDGAAGGDSWLVEVTNRPQADVAALVAALDGLGEGALGPLLAGTVEPQPTFRNLWYGQHETPPRLAAAVLALAYQTDAVRTNGG